MSRENESMLLLPVLEGVCALTEARETYAVRTEDGAIAVHIARAAQPGRLDGIPLLRGAARLVRAVCRPLRLLSVSQALHPQQLTRPSAEARALSRSLHLPRLTLTALRVAAIIALFALVLAVPPLALDQALRTLNGGLRAALLCLLRLALLPLFVRLSFRMKFLRRIALYRGAANKIADCLAGGRALDIETALTGRRLAAESDAAFLLLTALLLIVAGALLPLDFASLPLQILVRLLLVFALAGLLNEFVRPIERRPDSPLHRPLGWLQRTFTLEPHSEMLEVAITAVRAARGELRADAEAPEDSPA